MGSLHYCNIAIKIIDPQFSHVHRAIQRFIEEAQVGFHLQHLNTVPIHFSERCQRVDTFTMKEIKRQEFSELILEMHRSQTLRNKPVYLSTIGVIYKGTMYLRMLFIVVRRI